MVYITNDQSCSNCLGSAITPENINQWLNKYNDLDKLSFKTVLIICAGNLPLVGWHDDFICCYLLGAKVQLKLSKSDDVLIPELIKILTLFDADVENNIQVLEQKPMIMI